MPTGLAVMVAVLLLSVFGCTLLMSYRARLSNRLVMLIILAVLAIGIWGLIHPETADMAAYLAFGSLSAILYFRIDYAKNKLVSLLSALTTAATLYLFNRTFVDGFDVAGINAGITLGVISALCSCLFCMFTLRNVWFCSLFAPLVCSLLAAFEQTLLTHSAFMVSWSQGPWYDTICISISLGATLEHLLHMPYAREQEKQEQSPEKMYKSNRRS